ncbi:MAG: polysaccharide deacetylase family protein [Phycisphaerae bacterium]
MTVLDGVGLVLFAIVPGLVALELARCVYLETRRDRVPILLYHRLISGERARRGEVRDDEPIYAAYDDVFAEQMEYLHRAGYATLSLDELRAARNGGCLTAGRSVVITFDDGYESNHSLAFPALRRFGQKATIFVAPEPDAHTRALVAGVDGFLSAEQMRELDANGVAIESHTLTHCILNELPEAAARHELVESKRRLSEILGRPVRHLAIPRAGYSRGVRSLAIAAGYETICCNNKGTSNGRSDLYALPRIVIERDMSVAEFAALLRPRTGVVLRVVGNIKRIPERLLGARRARAIRQWLYHGPAAGLFVTRRLKRVVAGAAVAYAAAGLFFYHQWLSR